MRNFVVGKFWNTEQVLEALGTLKEKGIPVFDVYSPFPIHGIEPYMGIKRTRLTVASFIYGCIGGLSGVLLMSALYGLVWPMDIGGKPSLAFPDFVPVAYEMTILFAAHGIVYTFFIVGNYYPGKKVKLFDLRQTDDVFVVALDESKLDSSSQSIAKEAFAHAGAYEITHQTL